MTLKLGHINNRAIEYLDINDDMSNLTSIVLNNWVLFAIADKEQMPILNKFAEICLDSNVLYVCGAGELASEIDTEFDSAIVNRMIDIGEWPNNSDAFEDTAMTTFHSDFDEGFWFATFVAAHPTIIIERVLVANLTQHDYSNRIIELIEKINFGWLPPD